NQGSADLDCGARCGNVGNTGELIVKITPNITHPDEFFAELVRLHDGLSERQSLKLNAKIILLLANQIGDPVVLNAVLSAAAETLLKSESGDTSGAAVRGGG
ncbi:MAG: DUF2783 domain-containing protein, partial [Gammaproteobacteria bacterium]